MVVHLVSGEDSPFTPVAVLRIPPPRLSPFSINVSPQRISQFGPESRRGYVLPQWEDYRSSTAYSPTSTKAFVAHLLHDVKPACSRTSHGVAVHRCW